MLSYIFVYNFLFDLHLFLLQVPSPVTWNRSSSSATAARGAIPRKSCGCLSKISPRRWPSRHPATTMWVGKQHVYRVYSTWPRALLNKFTRNWCYKTKCDMRTTGVFFFFKCNGDVCALIVQSESFPVGRENHNNTATIKFKWKQIF